MFYPSSTQHSTAQHSTAQHSTAQHSTFYHILFFTTFFIFSPKNQKSHFDLNLMEISSDRPEPSCLLSCALPSLSLSLLPSVAGTYISIWGVPEEGGLCQVRVHSRIDYPHPFLMLNFMLIPHRVKQKPFTVQKTFQNKKRFWGIHWLPIPIPLPQKTNAGQSFNQSYISSIKSE